MEESLKGRKFKWHGAYDETIYTISDLEFNNNNNNDELLLEFIDIHGRPVAASRSKELILAKAVWLDEKSLPNTIKDSLPANPETNIADYNLGYDAALIDVIVILRKYLGPKNKAYQEVFDLIKRKA